MNDNAYVELRNFLRLVSDLRTVRRKLKMSDGVYESDADHSWSVGMIFMTLLPRLREEFGESFDALKIMKMAAIHDLPEVIVGDVVTWDDAARNGKDERELAAAKEIFGLLPGNQGSEMLALWQEAEAMQTLESKIVKSLDRLDPFFKRVVYGSDFADISDDKHTALEVYDRYQKDRHAFSETITAMYLGARREAIADGRFVE